ncbi:hypothetical protein [Paludisphaera borealis]|uniref:Chromosome partition protein Smc n=1 Tax=Paludisphaera borealis TaxID=1387353 RepID=A0A1U7CSG3_9BACT|nr:hypothetical protein [Paludisphaera borealis]APW61839.1 hypothetical protein BSF38_03368 [Paludisphaera borealis]
MHRICHVVLTLPLVVFSPAPSQAADSPAIAGLKEKGLARSGRFFVIDAEKPVLEKWKEARAVLTDHLATADRMKEAELSTRDLAQLEERRVELQAKLDEMNQQINEQGIRQGGGAAGFGQGGNRQGGFGQGAFVSQLISQRNMIRMNLAEITSTQKAFKADAGTDKKTLDAQGKQSLEAAKAVLTELRKSVDAVSKRYAELGSDASVKAALQTLEKDKLGTLKLGPSTEFTSVVKSLEKAERMILGKNTSTVSRKKGKSRR